MKAELSELLTRAPSTISGLNVAREYLQARILESLQHSGAMMAIAFQGGTALRFLYSLPRFSEDLDFALERSADRYDLRAWLLRGRASLAAEGYDVEVTLNQARVVHSARLRFPGLLYELGLSSRRQQVLSIKLDVDTRPPEGAAFDTTVVRRHRILRLFHHDRASLLAGKLHAVLQRPYPKGRDMYDLLWYLGARTWPAPNLALLANALKQTGWSGPEPTRQTWAQIVSERLAAMDFKAVVRDVAPFLERPDEAALLTKENLVALLRARAEGP